jgi:Ca-activated chloride channel homolog
VNQTGSAGQPRLRLFAGLFALLPLLGADQAEVAVREGNALYQAGQYEAALRRYEAAAEELPGSAVIEFNRGDALFKNRDQEQALDHYLAALATDDPELAARAKYNIGVIKYRQALAAAQRYEDALALTQAAIGYFRDSLKLDGSRDDARYNLELSYRFHHRLEQELLHAQRNAEMPGEKTSLRRGQAFSDKIRNEGSGQRDARADLNRQQHGQRANEVPENFSNNEETSKPPQMARLPIAMSPDAAHQLMEQLRERLEAAEIRRQERRRERLHQAAEPTPW